MDRGKMEKNLSMNLIRYNFQIHIFVCPVQMGFEINGSVTAYITSRSNKLP